MMHKQILCTIGLATLINGAAVAQEAPMTALRPDQVAFRALYKELVETNTTLSAGNCSRAVSGRAAPIRRRLVS